MFVQSQGAATEDTRETDPRTVTLRGRAFTTAALPSTVTGALAASVPPRSRFPRTSLEADV
ncbi:MAG TPA: hypothetical protein VKU41_29835 [Polyangiaceae bacterium]|nr:hypothetical protein [Polyangiaceae bacterium]